MAQNADKAGAGGDALECQQLVEMNSFFFTFSAVSPVQSDTSSFSVHSEQKLLK